MSGSPTSARLAAALLLAAFFAQSSVGIQSESLTFDEPAAIGSAYLAFRKQDLTLMKERPPLLGLLITPPLVLTGEPRLPPVGDPADVVADGRFGDALLHDDGNDTVRLVHVCRYAVLVASLGLGLALSGWASLLGGAGAGLLALFLFAFCPNLLAHSRIAANDMTCTIFLFVAAFALERFRRAPAGARGALAGLAVGLALAAKLTGLLVLPLVGLAGLLAWRSAGGRAAATGLALLAVVAFGALGACMGGTFDYAAYAAASGYVYAAARTADYLYYLGGEFSPRPWWYYYLYAAAIKTPLPLLLLVPCGLAALLGRGRHRADGLLPLAAVLLVLGTSCFDRANVGLRRILPAYPFAILIASQAVRLAVPRAVKAGVLGVLALWQAASVIRIGPHHLSYFNELVGGPTRGMLHLDDSNVDWGQELPGVRRWLDAHPGLPVRLAYFGTDRPETYGVALPAMDEDEEACTPGRAVYIVSAHLLVYFEKIARVRGTGCSWLRRYRPVDRIGYAMYVYDFR